MGCGPCGTGGSSATATTGGGSGTGFTIELRNGTKVGSFGTEQQARHSLNTNFNGAGKVIAKS